MEEDKYDLSTFVYKPRSDFIQYPSLTKDYLVGVGNDFIGLFFDRRGNLDKERFERYFEDVFHPPMGFDQNVFPLIVQLNYDMDSIRNYIIGLFYEYFDNAYDYPVLITPWYVEKVKPIITGQSSNPIIVKVLFNDKEYSHKMSEGLFFGVASVLSGTPELRFRVRFNIKHTKIMLEDISFNYYDPNVHRSKPLSLDNSMYRYYTYKEQPEINNNNYTAEINGKICYFNTLDVIQGVNTGASWLNVDPHNYISNIRENGVLVKF